MGKAVAAVMAVLGLVVMLAVPVGAKTTKSVHFTGKGLGGPISPTQSAVKYHDSYFGNGAAVQTTKVNATLTKGSDVTVSYFGDATTTSKDTFTIGKPNAKGIATLTGSGHDVSGTGKAKGVKSTYTFKGTVNLQTLEYSFTLTGTYHL